MSDIQNEVWSEIKITVDTNDIEAAGNIANMVVPYGIYIEDYSDLENEVMEIAQIDLIEEKLLEADRSKGIIHVYVNPHENPLEAVSFIEERLKNLNIKYDIQIDDCKTQDWVNNWKQYFHPMPIGNKRLIRPTWEDEYDAGERKVLHIEPGLAFGTGSHPTPKLCLETLENGFDESKFKAVQGNLSDKVTGKYNVIVANIVADIIMEFNKEVGKYLDDGGVYITGGIIESREDEVLLSFAQNSFEVIERFEEKGWLVFVLKKA